jgi:hypothetical protein
MYKLYLNNFTGNYLGCKFINGVATTDNEKVINYYKRHKLKFEEVVETKEEEKPVKKTRKTKSSVED